MFWCVFAVSGVALGSTFGVFLEKVAFFWESVVPSFLIDPTMFLLDFLGPGFSETITNQEKRQMEISGFLVPQKTAPGSIF